MTALARTIRDNSGAWHKRGEPVVILGTWRELGTHRTLLKVVLGETKAVLLPEDVEERK